MPNLLAASHSLVPRCSEHLVFGERSVRPPVRLLAFFLVGGDLVDFPRYLVDFGSFDLFDERGSGGEGCSVQPLDVRAD